MIYEFFRYFLLLEIIWRSILFNNINMVDKKYITKLYRQITTFKEEEEYTIIELCKSLLSKYDQPQATSYFLATNSLEATIIEFVMIFKTPFLYEQLRLLSLVVSFQQSHFYS